MRKKISEKGLSNSFEFINELKNQDKLYIAGSISKVSIGFPVIRELARFCELFYPGCWDFDFSVDASDKEVSLTNLSSIHNFNIKGILIHFPEFDITNSEGKSHNIRNLYVRLGLSFRSDTLVISSIRGLRTTITSAEYRSSYGHSHLDNALSGAKNGEFRDFCLGSGEINIYLASFNSGKNVEKHAQSLLMQLTALVSWESLEGVPYRYMHDISKRQSLRSKQTVKRYAEDLQRHSPTVYKVLLESIQLIAKAKGKDRPDIRYSPAKGAYEILRNEKAYNYFRMEHGEIPSSIMSDTVIRLFVKDLPGDNYESYSSSGGGLSDEERRYSIGGEKLRKFLFKGKWLTFRVEPNTVSPETSFTLCREMVDIYLNSIEKEINIQESIAK